MVVLHICYTYSRRGTEFTDFTGTKVQILGEIHMLHVYMWWCCIYAIHIHMLSPILYLCTYADVCSRMLNTQVKELVCASDLYFFFYYYCKHPTAICVLILVLLHVTELLCAPSSSRMLTYAHVCSRMLTDANVTELLCAPSS